MNARQTENGGISPIGLPGAGKSTIGTLLSLKTGLQLLDTDVWIEQENQATLRQLYREHGEEFLFKRERCEKITWKRWLSLPLEV